MTRILTNRPGTGSFFGPLKAAFRRLPMAEKCACPLEPKGTVPFSRRVNPFPQRDSSSPRRAPAGTMRSMVGWSGPSPAGFTLVEVMVVSGLMAFLAVLLAKASAGIGRPAAEVIRRSQGLQEMNLAAAALARDLGGSLADPAGRLGPKTLGKFDSWLTWSDSQYPPNSVLQLSFANGTSPDNVVTYSVQPDTAASAALGSGQTVYWLVRQDSATNTTFTVARNLSGFQVTSTGGNYQINLSFLYRVHQPQGQSPYLTRTCSLMAKAP